MPRCLAMPCSARLSVTRRSRAGSLGRCLLLAVLCWLGLASSGLAADRADCTQAASDACLLEVQPQGSSLKVRYYASLATGAVPRNAVIAIHGHPHDANKTFDATLGAARSSGEVQRTLIVAPILQPDASHARRCSTPGVPEADGSELTWTCESWMEGAPAENDAHVTSFAAMDALVADILKRFPSVHTVTVAGFSAGAQMVQHYIAFAASAPAGTRIRFVVADPGTWLYFDPVRPVVDASPSCRNAGDAPCAPGFARPDASACASYDQWKFGIATLPPALAQIGDGARGRYVQADIHYLEGDLDTGEGPGRASRVLDRSCGANLEGSFRLQRGQSYEAYDLQILAPSTAHPLAIVPGCAHDVACVFPSDAGRQALFEF